MNKGLKLGLGVLAALIVAVGGQLLYLHHRNVEDRKAPAAATFSKTDPDDMTTYSLKHEHPMSLKDEKDLKGRDLWMSAGGQMDFYPYNGHVDYAHSAGVLLGAEKILVKDAVEQVAPKSAAFRIPQGDKQVLLVFTRPDSAEPKKEFAVPVGYKQGGDYTFETDNIFFYQDPHTTFSYWGPEVWKAIDAHQAILGMKETQVQMALGQISKPQGDMIGERSVWYEAQGKPKLITFEHNKATNIVDGAK